MRLRLSNLQFGSSGCIGVCTVGASDKSHPNKMPFNGTLLILDQASDKPPHGAEGHRIYVPTSVAKKRLETLINMGTNYSHELNSHAPQHKVGVITGARISGNKVLVNGFLWKRDFPSVERDLRAGKLGMSMELQDVSVRDKDAPVWYLEDFHFSGATILFKSAAAYTQTSLAAAGAIKQLSEEWGKLVNAEIERFTILAAAAAHTNGGSRMAKPKEKERSADSNGQGEVLVRAIAAGVGPAISAAIRASLKPFVGVLEKQQASIARIAASVEESKALSLEAARHEDDEEENEDDEKDIHAARHEDDDEDMAAHGDSEDDDDDEEDGKKKKGEDDDDDDEELDAALEHLEDDHADEEPGEINEDAENEGDKTTRKGKVGKSKHMKELVKANRISASGSSVIRELYASHRALRKKYRTLRAKAEEDIDGLKNKVEALEAQAEQYAERTDRRSVSAELGNFLSKNNVDIRELRAEGKKLSVSEIDTIFANAPVELDPTTRMWFKNQLLAADLMEQGEVHRGIQ